MAWNTFGYENIEHFSMQKVQGDGRCMFRSLVKGMAANKGLSLRVLVNTLHKIFQEKMVLELYAPVV